MKKSITASHYETDMKTESYAKQNNENNNKIKQEKYYAGIVWIYREKKRQKRKRIEYGLNRTSK